MQNRKTIYILDIERKFNAITKRTSILLFKKVCYAAQQKIYFTTSCRNIIFFLKKQYLLRHKVLTEYFFLPISETEIFYQSNLPTESPPPQKKNHSPPTPLQFKWMFPKGSSLHQTIVSGLGNLDLYISICT